MIANALPSNVVTEFFGFDVDAVIGLNLDVYLVNQYNITKSEIGSGVKPGYLCVETSHGKFKEPDALGQKNFVCTIAFKGNKRHYYFAPTKLR